MSLAVTLLGTGSPMPSPDRAGPATLISAGEGPEAEHYLVDAGRGVLMRLAATMLGAPNLTAVLITHLHSDHITDLNDVITTRWVMTFEETPLTIVGPVGTQKVVDHILASLDPDIEYRLAHHEDLDHRPPVTVIEVNPDEQGGVVELPDGQGGKVAITCGQTDHKPVEPSVGFRFDERSGKIRPGLTNIGHLVGISTYGSPKWYVRAINDNGRRTLMRALRVSCGLRVSRRWVGLYAIDSEGHDARSEFAARVEREMSEL